MLSLLERFRVQKALERGSIYTLEQIERGLEIGEFQKWSVDSGILITSIQTDDHKFCLLLACSGTFGYDWREYLRQIERWAKAHGCKEMRIVGRKGWAKVLEYWIDGKDGPFYRISKTL